MMMMTDDSYLSCLGSCENVLEGINFYTEPCFWFDMDEFYWNNNCEQIYQSLEKECSNPEPNSCLYTLNKESMTVPILPSILPKAVDDINDRVSEMDLQSLKLSSPHSPSPCLMYHEMTEPPIKWEQLDYESNASKPQSSFLNRIFPSRRPKQQQPTYDPFCQSGFTDRPISPPIYSGRKDSFSSVGSNHSISSSSSCGSAYENNMNSGISCYPSPSYLNDIDHFNFNPDFSPGVWKIENSPDSSSGFGIHRQNIIDPPVSEMAAIRLSNSPDSTTVTVKRRGRRRKNQLWQFFLEILSDPSCRDCIQWENRDIGTFRFVDSKKVAQLWAKRKKRTHMSFEYLSRAIRYYYQQEIMSRVCDGRRLVYKFGPNADGWKTYGTREC